MGQAKQRGTKEERISTARQLKKNPIFDTPSERGRMERDSLVNRFIAVMNETALRHNIGENVKAPYRELLTYMWTWENEYRGACHSTSAVLFVLLSELKLEPRLCIGEVRAKQGCFDHSWVEVNGRIFDVAISLPDISGKQVSGPLFGSIDLETGKTCNLRFGVSDGIGLDENALVPKDCTLDGYALAQRDRHRNTPELDLWELSAKLAAQIGLDCSISQLQTRYGGVRREYRRADVKIGII